VSVGRKILGDTRLWIALGFAIIGSLVIGFVFVPALSPGTDPVWAFGGSLAFMLITMAAGAAAKSGY
jgi:hypothetical protein